jgi:lipoyl synthase
VEARAFPAWMKKGISYVDDGDVARILQEQNLNTVCREAACPNRGECYKHGTATFLILGRICTRRCSFCDISKGTPAPLDPDEPQRLALAAKKLGLRFVVVTSVTRDDISDGGASVFAEVIRNLHEQGITGIEVLTPDFLGDLSALDKVLAAVPSVFNHNVETVPRLYPAIRPIADYERSLAVLAHAASRELAAKSGIMVGLGERPDEVIAVLHDLKWAGVGAVTIGQYLAPSSRHAPVKEFISPARFEWYAEQAREIGLIPACGPFVRSSYKAEEIFRELSARKTA